MSRRPPSLSELRDQLAAVDAERRALLPVVRAALTWQKAEDNDDPRVDALLDAIDALPKDLKVRLRESA